MVPVGIWLYSDRFYFGASVTQIISNTTMFLPTGEGEIEIFDLEAHYFANVGYKLDIGDERSRMVFSTLLFFLNQLGLHQGILILILGLRSRIICGLVLLFRQDDSFSALVGFSAIEDFAFTYSYDYINFRYWPLQWRQS